MKYYKFHISPQTIQYQRSIRNKASVIRLLLEISRFLLITPVKLSASQKQPTADEIELILYIDKMSRVFLVEPDKIHSFHFPFALREEGERFELSCQGFAISNATCSILAATFHSLTDENPIEGILERYWEISSDFELSEDEMLLCGKLITFLLSFEPGYLRFDHDEIRSSSLHPVDHVDFNYTNGISFKFKISQKADPVYAIDVVNNATPCYSILPYYI